MADKVKELDEDAAKIREELKPFYNVTDEELKLVVPNEWQIHRMKTELKVKS